MIAHKLRVFALILLALLPIEVIAQNDGVVLIHQPESYGGEAMWSADSQAFVFYEYLDGGVYPHVNVPVESWTKLNIATGNVTHHTRWPLQPFFTLAEREILQTPYEPGDALDEYFAFESLDGRFVLCVCYGTKIFDRTQGAATWFNVAIIQADRGPRNAQVMWSRNGEAFVALNIDEYGFLYHYYVSNYSENVEDVQFRDVAFTANSHAYRIYANDTVRLRDKVYDLSDDGKLVLLLGRRELEEPYSEYRWPQYPIVWNTADPDASYILDDLKPETIDGMSFVHGSDTELWIINEDGLLRYDLTINLQVVIDPDFAADDLYFSPDGKYLASVCCSTDYRTLQITIRDLGERVE